MGVKAESNTARIACARSGCGTVHIAKRERAMGFGQYDSEEQRRRAAGGLCDAVLASLRGVLPAAAAVAAAASAAAASAAAMAAFITSSAACLAAASAAAITCPDISARPRSARPPARRCFQTGETAARAVAHGVQTRAEVAETTGGGQVAIAEAPTGGAADGRLHVAGRGHERRDAPAAEPGRPRLQRRPRRGEPAWWAPGDAMPAGTA